MVSETVEEENQRNPSKMSQVEQFDSNLSNCLSKTFQFALKSGVSFTHRFIAFSKAILLLYLERARNLHWMHFDCSNSACQWKNEKGGRQGGQI